MSGGMQKNSFAKVLLLSWAGFLKGYIGVFWCSKIQPFRVWGKHRQKLALIPWLGFQFNPSLIRGEEDGFLCQA